MKRAAEDLGDDQAKRAKFDPNDLFGEGLERSAGDVCERGTDCTGYICGTVIMAWPRQKKKIRVNIQSASSSSSEKFRFDVELTGAFVSEYFDDLKLQGNDAFQLALRGVKVEKTNASSVPSSLPMKLKYENGVAIKWLKRSRKFSDDGTTLDIWKLQENKAEDVGDWFSTPPKPTSTVVHGQPLAENTRNGPSVAPISGPICSVARPSGSSPPSNNSRNSTSSPSTHSATTPVVSVPVKQFVTRPDKRKPFRSARNPSPGFDPIGMSSRNDTPSVTQPLLSSRIFHDSSPPLSHVLAQGQPQPSVQLQPKTPHSQTQYPDPSRAHTMSKDLEQNHAQFQPEDQEGEKQLSKKGRKNARRRAKKLKAASLAATTNCSAISDSAGNHAQSIANNVVDAQEVSVSEDTTAGPSDVPSAHVATQILAEGSTSHINNALARVSPPASLNEAYPIDPLAMVAQSFWSDNGMPYIPLQAVKAGSHVSNIIAVVTEKRPISKVPNKDWMVVLTLHDPSKYDRTVGLWPADGLRLNCFSHHEQWLPQVKLGDVVVLQGIKSSAFNYSISSVGYHEKLKWALYDPPTNSFCHPVADGTPQSEGLAEGYGYDISPFAHPGQPELEYCRQLSEWWAKVREKEEIREANTTVYQIGGAKKKRQHRLICDAGPEVQPQGFFDCTVEVLFGHANDNGPYSLYVTDYTVNRSITPIQASWCPPNLADRVLKVEMWDDATPYGKDMSPGEYYFIGNNRMKISQGGFVEGTFCMPEKLRKLDENDQDDERLKALLTRKTAWENESGLVSNTVDHRLIKDFVEGGFANCTVQIVHMVHRLYGSSCLFVTDYTTHDYGPNLNLDELTTWGRNLEARIFKIWLRDAQVDMSKGLNVGDFCSIKKLRMKKDTTANTFIGQLGGSERLVYKLKVKETTDEHLQALLARKDLWEQNVAGSSNETRQESLSIAPGRPRPRGTLKEILDSETCPPIFCVIARIVDFWPLRLEEFVTLQCTKCGQDIPANRKGCFDCYDKEHIKCYYKFFFRLQDQEGTQLVISVSEPECSLLQGLPPTDLRENQHALHEFKDRLKPLIGNLEDVHEGLVNEEKVETDTPMLTLTIVNWSTTKDERLFSFVRSDHL